MTFKDLNIYEARRTESKPGGIGDPISLSSCYSASPSLCHFFSFCFPLKFSFLPLRPSASFSVYFQEVSPFRGAMKILMCSGLGQIWVPLESIFKRPLPQMAWENISLEKSGKKTCLTCKVFRSIKD